jgi:hypothetical protein
MIVCLFSYYETDLIYFNDARLLLFERLWHLLVCLYGNRSIFINDSLRGATKAHVNGTQAFLLKIFILLVLNYISPMSLKVNGVQGPNLRWSERAVTPGPSQNRNRIHRFY